MTKQLTRTALLALVAFTSLAAFHPPKTASAQGYIPHPSQRSMESRHAVLARWANYSNETQELFWLDFNGQRRHYKSLEPGRTFEQQSFATHVWVAESRSGTSQTFTLTMRSQQYFQIEPQEPQPHPQPAGRPTMATFKNQSSKTIQIKLLSPAGEVSYVTIAAYATEQVAIHVGWKAESVQSGPYQKLNLPEITDGMVFTVNGTFNGLRLHWEWGAPVDPTPAPQNRTLQDALGIQVQELGGGRLLVLDTGYGAGRQLLSRGDIIASHGMVGIPLIAGRPPQNGGILAQLRVLPADGGPMQTVDVRSRVGTIIINN